MPMSSVQQPSLQALHWNVEAADSGLRLDRFVTTKTAQVFPKVSRSYILSYLEKGRVTVNGKQCRKSTPVETGQNVTIQDFIDPSTRQLQPYPDLAIQIIHQNKDFLVLHKPAGIPSHAISYEDKNTVCNWLLAHFPEVREVGEDDLRPGIVHRLDTDTSGLFLAALNKKSFDSLRQLFHDRAITKEYRALVQGRFPFDQKTIQWPIAHHPKAIHKMIVTPNPMEAERLKARDATTHVTTLQRWKDYSFLKVGIETGRTHQIRVHLAFEGHPISGDLVYRKEGERQRDWLKPSRQMLHASHLSFKYKSKQFKFNLDIPEDFKSVISQL